MNCLSIKSLRYGNMGNREALIGYSLYAMCRMEVVWKIRLICWFFTRLFVPQASQSSLYRRTESEIQFAIPSALEMPAEWRLVWKMEFFTREICVCAHLTQTRDAQRACAEMENSVKNMPDSIFFARLFVPQASQSSFLSQNWIWNSVRDSFGKGMPAEWGLVWKENQEKKAL